MKPESLLGIALELLERLVEPGRLPADARVGSWFRERRFLGSKDRRFVAEAAYAWLRHWQRSRPRWAAWKKNTAPALATPLDPGVDDRGTILADLLMLAGDGLLPWTLDEVCQAAKAMPSPPLAAADLDTHFAPGLENRVLASWWPEDPCHRRAAEWSLPVWIADRLTTERGEAEARALAQSLLEPATFDLRVNVLQTTREAALESLQRQVAVPVELTPWSPTGLRLRSRANIRDVIARSRGALEVADEGSQVIVHALSLAPGSTVIDACAGAGGKTLAMTEAVLDRGSPGRVFACDTAPERMEELRRRARNAGLDRAIRVVPLRLDGPLPDALKPADLVLVDAPCSGLGTLRRNPELKRRHTADDIRAFAVTQAAILRRFAPLVRPGGRIAYATCSILAEENEDVARAFAAEHPELVEWRSPWAAARLPEACWHGNWLLLDPWRTHTDGFFLAVWQLPL